MSVKDEPTTRELKIMLDNLSKNSEQRHLDYKETHNQMMTTLNLILEQAKKTNGRVSGLEYWQKSFKWAGAILTTILTGLTINYFK